jgi:hypothetical protein
MHFQPRMISDMHAGTTQTSAACLALFVLHVQCCYHTHHTTHDTLLLLLPLHLLLLLLADAAGGPGEPWPDCAAQGL